MSFGVVLSSFSSYTQPGWTWMEMSPMPMAISNNAVTTGSDDGEQFVYSFGGIDTSKTYSGITQNSFRYRVSDDTWEEIASLPSALPLIASAASTIQNRIYIIGGYNVNLTGEELSSNEVIIFDPESNTYISGGEEIPVPIDDHVQCVWRDSLIYVISGWSNTGNINNVQIYNPALNNWQEGTPVPNHIDYKVFGASGKIIGDTIYYYGGATQSTDFPASEKLRKGVINADNPTEIDWTLLDDGPNKKYRSACISYENDLFWIGGSAVSYNYNGTAYNGSGGVEPLYQILQFDAENNEWIANDDAPVGIMDMRGIGQIATSLWVICGGMLDDQVVSDKTFLISYDPSVTGIEENNHASLAVINHQIFFEGEFENIQLIGLDGKLLWESENDLFIPSHFNGVFILSVNQGENKQRTNKKIVLP